MLKGTQPGSDGDRILTRENGLTSETESSSTLFSFHTQRAVSGQGEGERLSWSKISLPDLLGQRLANFLYKRPESEYFSLCGPCCLCHSHSTLPSWWEVSHRQHGKEMGVSQRHCIFRRRHMNFHTIVTCREIVLF